LASETTVANVIVDVILGLGIYIVFVVGITW
jgi:hypothetical protein